MARVLVTARSLTMEGHPALDVLTESGFDVVFSAPGRLPTETELIDLLPGCVGYLAGVEPISRKVLESARDLKVISRNGTGVDNIDLQTADRLNISVCRAVGANARGVAELTIALMLALVRGIPAGDRSIKSGEWKRSKGIELESRTLGIIGCGRVGRLVAGLALALGMDVIAYDLEPDTSFAPSERFRFSSLDTLLKQSDIISLHCPSSGQGSPIIDAEALERTKPGVFIVNTARPDLIDTESIIAFLDGGHVAGVATDVFDREPPVDDVLAAHDRVIATAHIGGFTEESVGRATRAAVKNLLEHLNESSG